MIQTVDYITPVVDDPYQFGMIAAANAISDIYAMGATPAFALNLVGYPNKALPMEILRQILRGGADKASEAGISIIGGHSINDHAPKYGLVVTGFINPNNLITKKGARQGDLLVLTKPLGVGVITSGIDKCLTSPEMEKAVIEIMCRLNKDAAEAMSEVGVSACTDITGFGLLGHLLELLAASDVGAKIESYNIPFIPGAKEMIEAWTIASGVHNNYRYVKDRVVWPDSITKEMQFLLCDPQTSGGLLIAVEKNKLNRLLQLLKDKKVDSWIIGEIIEDKKLYVL